MADYLNIAGRVRTTASDGVAMEAQEVKDLNLNKSQQEINADVQTELGDRYTKEETYSKEQLDDLITTPDVNYVSVVATNATTAVTDILPATGEANTIYRVGNWNGTQYDTTMYALFAWNGTTYVCLAVRSFVGEVYDISVNHPDGQGNPTPYADLAAAIGTSGANIPADIRRGGMSIKFIQGNAQSSDNKYVQARLMAQNFTTDTTQWQGVDDEPVDGSDNLVKSGGVRDYVDEQVENILGKQDIDIDVTLLNWESGGIDASTGEVTSASTLFWTEVNVKGYSKIKFWSFITTGNNGYAFFDSSRNYISGGKNPYIDSTSVSKYVTVDVPASAKYIRLSNSEGNKTKDICLFGTEGEITAYCVCLYPQTLSSDKKSIARTNIGAASQQDLQNISDAVEELNSKVDEQQVTVKPYDSQNNLLCENTGYINSTGSSQTVQNYVYTNFIDIAGATEIKVKCLLNSSYHVGGVDFYTAKSFNSWISKIEEISGSEDQQKNSEGTITANMIPSGAKYMVVSCWLNTLMGKGDYYVEITKEIEGELPQRISVLSEEINALSEDIEDDIEPTNYALLFSIISGKKYDSEGTLVDDSLYNSTTLVKLDKDKNLYIGTASSSNAIAQFFNSSKEPISQLTGNALTPISKDDYPSGAVYVAFSYLLSSVFTDIFYVSANPISVCPSRYSTILKKKGTRPKLYIHTTDTEVQICEKMVQAVLTWDCDVIWDFGTYTFTTMWDWMKANWDAFASRNTYELPIGGNCRYYFNNSTIIMNNSSEVGTVRNNSNLFGTARALDSSYELFDGTLIRHSGGNYCVHDEGQNLNNPYIHKYNNLTMRWEYNNSPSSIGTCIGMGMGKHGEIVVDNCLLFSGQPSSSDSAIFKCHGRNDSSSQEVTQFKLTIKDCYIGTFISLGSMNTNETCIAHVCGNSMESDIQIASSGSAQYTVYKHGNEIRA